MLGIIGYYLKGIKKHGALFRVCIHAFHSRSEYAGFQRLRQIIHLQLHNYFPLFSVIILISHSPQVLCIQLTNNTITLNLRT